MNLEELQTAANELCQEHWNINYTGEIKLVSQDWKWKNAHFETMKSNPDHQVIVMSKKKNKRRTRGQILGSLLHELVHWRLWSLNVPFDDTDDEFIEECINVCAPFSKTQSAQKALKQYLNNPKQMNIDDYL